VNVIAYNFNNNKNEWFPINNLKKISQYKFYILLPQLNKMINTDNDSEDNYPTSNEVLLDLGINNKNSLNEEICKRKEKLYPYPIIIIENNLIEPSILIIEKFFPSNIFLEKGNDYFCVIRTEQLIPIIGFQFTSSILLDRFITQFEKNLNGLKVDEELSFFINEHQLSNRNCSIPKSNPSAVLRDISIETFNHDLNIKLSIIHNDSIDNETNKIHPEKSLYYYSSYYGMITTSSTIPNNIFIILYITMIARNIKFYRDISTETLPVDQIFLASKIIYNNREWTGLPLFEKNKLFLETGPLESLQQIHYYLKTHKLLSKYVNMFPSYNPLINTMQTSLRYLTEKINIQFKEITTILKKQIWIFHHETFHFMMNSIKNLDFSIHHDQDLSHLFHENIKKYSNLWVRASNVFDEYSFEELSKDRINEDMNINTHGKFHKFHLYAIPNFETFQTLWYSFLPSNFQYHQNEESNQINNKKLFNGSRASSNELNVHFQQGFVSTYAMTSFDEDLAETWAFLMTYNFDIKTYLQLNSQTIQQLLLDEYSKNNFKTNLNNISEYYQSQNIQMDDHSRYNIICQHQPLLRNKIELLLSLIFLSLQ